MPRTSEAALFRRYARTLNVPEARLVQERGRQATARDAIWTVLNQLVLERERPRVVYWEMALFVREEGRDPRPYQRLAHDADLRDLAARGVHAVEVLGHARACAPCAGLDGTTLPLAHALRDGPLPVAGCACTPRRGPPGWCACMYLAPSTWPKQ